VTRSPGWLVRRTVESALIVPVAVIGGIRERLPGLATSGRRHINSSRVIGKFAVDAGLRQAAKAAESLLDGLAAEPMPSDSPDGSDLEPRVGVTEIPSVRRSDASELPIPDYDSLAASQVVPRLRSLSPDELAAVAAYESATRGRRTILAAVARLEA